MPAGRRGPLASRGPYARAYCAYRLMRPWSHAAAAARLQLSADRAATDRPGPQQQTHSSGVRRPDGTDGQTDGRTDGRTDGPSTVSLPFLLSTYSHSMRIRVYETVRRPSVRLHAATTSLLLSAVPAGDIGRQRRPPGARQ